MLEILDILLHSCSSAGRHPCRLFSRTDSVAPLTSFLAGPGLFGPLPHLLPKGSKRCAPISVLDVALDEGANDVAGAFSLLACQSLEVLLQVVVDPNGQLGHGFVCTSRLFDCARNSPGSITSIWPVANEEIAGTEGHETAEAGCTAEGASSVAEPQLL